MQTVIETTNLTRNFGELTAVDALTIEVVQGETIGILGHNGAGKTTTVRLLNGLLEPTSGAARVLGLDPIQDGPAIRMHTGVLTEFPAVDEKLTALENMHIFGKLYKLPATEIIPRTQELLDQFGLSSRANDRAGAFSKGMRQRLALARTLLHNPHLLFLDEPTSGLDPAATRQVHQIINGLHQDRSHTIILCTHNLTEAQRLCDKVAVMEHGRLVAFGTTTQLVQHIAKGIKLLIEVKPGDAAMAERLLNSFQCVQKTSADRGSLTVWLRSREGIPDLIDHLSSHQVRLYRVDPQEPTLEDVYFALHDHNNTDREKEGPDEL
ncbi:MAG: ABC transporter ATP-binding protein [Anaerolineae bacterium]|nr:ABC transporter ATP-binding protein [Anaerolineae bacterium]